MTGSGGSRGAAIWIVLVCLAGPPAAAAQTALVTAAGGISAGDGGPAATVVASGGYLTGRRVGFELEVGFTPGLEFPGPDVVIQGNRLGAGLDARYVHVFLDNGAFLNGGGLDVARITGRVSWRF